MSKTDQRGENMKVIENYQRAIENSDENLLKEVFAPQVRVEIPAGGSIDQAGAASYVMSVGNDWYFLGFEGQFEGQTLQAVDQVHLNKEGQIDQLIIYMRPIPAAQKFGEVISQRLQTAR